MPAAYGHLITQATSRKCPAEGNKVYSRLSTGPNVCRQTRELIKILPLEFRRDISDLCLLLKSRTGAITTDVNKYICTFEPGYQSRNYDKNNYN
jgi:hypothetical protein